MDIVDVENMCNVKKLFIGRNEGINGEIIIGGMPDVMVFPGSNVFGCEMTIDCQGENIDDD